MIFIGDLYQLPSVVTSKEKEGFKLVYETPFFFSSKAFQEGDFEFIEFEKAYKQSDPTFVEISNGIRNNTVTEEMIEKLNERVQPGFARPRTNSTSIFQRQTRSLKE